MEQTLIIYAHPYPKSFNHAVLDKVEATFKTQSREYEVIDLYQDGFDPRYTTEELALFSKGETLDPLVRQYQDKLKKATAIIIISPVWWNDIPAILKGFFDKVMKQKFAYVATSTGVKGMLDNIQSATVITTSTSPTWYLRLFSGNAIKRVFLNGTIKQIGIKNRKWINFGGITGSKKEKREQFLKELEQKII
ncbi:NAD(P)H-dependent oxidoreductase [Lactobacillus sp. YT155]|uniref:NAD(P)H-dependent oxidoreductase n=1 Tax=Lactobacillus sp. YT155 TaxID=3060955 RepID=UPI00265FFA98|nr:NAD(P)H-dependent oxidoreductase [Lactobacillus sp. YT155]MDO1605179.1 NAD(P)H-dependent oxidoreductase [Lactobacillus sp. YT155]